MPAQEQTANDKVFVVGPTRGPISQVLAGRKMWEDCVRTALGVDVVEASREFLVLPNRKSLRTSLEHGCSRSHEKTKQTRRKLKTSVHQPMFTQRTKTTHAHTDSKHTSITASSTQRSWCEHRVLGIRETTITDRRAIENKEFPRPSAMTKRLAEKQHLAHTEFEFARPSITSTTL